MDRGPSRTTWPPVWMPKEPSVEAAPAEMTDHKQVDKLETLPSEPTIKADPAPPIPLATAWPAAAANFVLLLTADDLPEDPRAYGQECVQVDRELYIAALKADIRRGPTGPRARYGAIQDDLLALQKALVAPQPAESKPSMTHPL